MNWSVFTNPDYILGSGAKAGATQRFFAALDPVQQGHYVMQNPIIETGDLSYKVDFLTSSGAAQKILQLYTDTPAQKMALQLEPGGFVKFSTDGNTPGQGAVNRADGVLHELRLDVNVTTGAFTVFVDGNVEYTGTHDSPALLSQSFDLDIGRRRDNTAAPSSEYFDGIIADVDLGNGNTWKLSKDGATTTEQSSGGANILTRVNVAAVDVELFTLNTSTTPDQWENPDKTVITPVAS